MASYQPEQRRATRFAYVCDVECEALGHVSLNRIKNLSATGAWIETLDPPPEGSILKLSFSVGSIDVRTKAKVVRRVIGEGMGVAFQDLQPHYGKAIDILSVNTYMKEEHGDQRILRQIMKDSSPQ